jgi:hypothetical protein
MATPTTSDHDQTHVEAPKAQTDKSLGLDFDSMTDLELLLAAASNAFHNRRALRQIKIMATVLGLVVSLILIKLFGLTGCARSRAGSSRASFVSTRS